MTRVRLGDRAVHEKKKIKFFFGYIIILLSKTVNLEQVQKYIERRGIFLFIFFSLLFILRM